MTFNYLFLLPVLLFLLLVIFRAIYFRGKNVPATLFAEALKNENSGQYEAAVINYTNALVEVEKGRFRDHHLKNKILDKLKVLHTAIEYEKNIHYGK